MAQQRILAPRTWAEFASAAQEMTVDTNGDGIVDRYGVALPGDPFFIDQFAAELLASNGGGFFDENGRPDFESQKVIQMLEFFKQLSKQAPPDWYKYSYLEQFQAFASGKVAMVPVCYARALKNIEKDADSTIADSVHFGFIPQPVGPSGSKGIATMDCEDWTILKATRQPELARSFLEFFYKPENYLMFCQTVPIHLTPIIRSVAASSEYNATPMVTRWKGWQAHTIQLLENREALPIMMSRFEDRELPKLMELGADRVITNMILAVCKEGRSPGQAASEAQAEALKIVAEK